MPTTLTRSEMVKRLEVAFAPPQTEALVDILDEIRQAEIERAEDTRALKEGLVTTGHSVIAIAEDTRALKEGQTRLTDAMARLANRMDELAHAQKRTELKVEELADVQKRTELKVEQLADAQKRTELKVEQLTDAQKRTELKVEQLADAQKRTEQKVEQLADAQKRTELKVEQLADAQKRTELKVEQLADAQKRTEQKVEQLTDAQKQLADAQKRTELKVEQLVDAQKETQKDIQTLTKQLGETNSTLGGLGQSMAYALENEAYRMLPALLAEKYGIEIHERLIRTEIEGEEINIFGRGQQNGQGILVVGETKLSLDGRRRSRQGQKTFFEQLQAKEEAVRKGYPDEEIVLLAITHYARTKVRKVAEEAGIIVVQSFEW